MREVNIVYIPFTWSLRPLFGRKLNTDKFVVILAVNCICNWTCLFELEFYGPINTIKVMSSQSVNLVTLFLRQA